VPGELKNTSGGPGTSPPTFRAYVFRSIQHWRWHC